MTLIKLEQKIVSDFEAATSREWLETNGIGGYASGTISGANTRRYHGLLVAATKPPLGRMVLISKFEETLILDGQRFELSSNRFPGTIHPCGYRFLAHFRLDPFPIWTYNIDGVEIEKRAFMVNGENTTVVRWTVVRKEAADDRPISLELRPLLAFRDHHHLRHQDGEFDPGLNSSHGRLSFSFDCGVRELQIAHNGISVESTGHWYRSFEYSVEQERGFDFTEDLFQPCSIMFDLNVPATVIASTELRNAGDADILEQSEIGRRAALIARANVRGNLSRQLVLAADQFIVRRGTGHTIIAGYPWFSDWGRDTMIALPGLTLETNRPEIAKSILAEFALHISEGMLPNRFPDEGEVPEYNTVDATLWFFEALRAYVEVTQDYEFVRDQLYPKLVDIIEWHVRGTRFGIRVDADGLLHAGDAGVQLTWMDAKVGDWVVTPRTGKPVEIQALWFNALCILADLAERFNEAIHEARYREMAAAAKSNFLREFWNDDEQCLYDVVDGWGKDGAIRPNQIFAVSLHHSMLDAIDSRRIVDKVEAELLTLVGIRSLAARDPEYASNYVGSPQERDASYHQGTVWSWLLGPFIQAYRKTHPQNAHTDRRVDELLAAVEEHLSEAMVGQVSEIFDAAAPNAARGCPAQAWSVAEVLRGSRLTYRLTGNISSTAMA